jgi:hypothetical protein
VRTTGTIPGHRAQMDGHRAQMDVLITDKAVGDGEHVGAVVTDTKPSHCQTPSSFCFCFSKGKDVCLSDVHVFPLTLHP